MTQLLFVLVESNTTGTGRDFAVAAVQRGMRPVLLSRAPERYPYVAELGLEVRLVDTTDDDEVLAACRELGLGNIRGITTSSDLYIGMAARLARRVGLPAPDSEAIALCQDKAALRSHLSERGIPVPRFVACTTEEDVEKAAVAEARPVVVKPSQGTGSQGVRLCETPVLARQWARRILRGEGTPPARTVLVEQEIRGPEYSVEVLDGAVVGVTAKHIGKKPYFVETGHDFPARVNEGVDTALRSTALSALRSVGLMTGPAHVELRSDGAQAWLIEINPRLAGGLIPRLVTLATGRDLVDGVVARATGYAPRPPAGLSRHASIRFLLSDEGVVESVTGLDCASGIRHVDEVVCAAAPGQRLTDEHSFKDRRGYVISVADRAEDAMAAAEQARGCIHIKVC